MRILLINHYAGSPLHGMEFRPYYMARAWQKLGHETRIVAAGFSHLRSRQPGREAAVRFESVGGVEYCWLRTDAYSGNGFGRVRNMTQFVGRLFLDAGRITDAFRPDVVVASSTYPLDVVPAARIARRNGAKLVHEIHDLWPLSPRELGNMSRWHPFILVMQAAEDYAARTVDAVVSMLPRAEPHLRSRGLAPGRFTYVPNGVDTTEWLENTEAVPAETERAIAGFRRRFEFLVGYAGSHGVANALDSLLATADLLRGHPVGFVLVGQGPEKARLQARAAELGLENVLFLEPVPKRTIPDLLDRMDALYIGWRRNPLYRFGVSPNKLMDYMMSGKPIIHAIEAANDPVAEAECGVSVLPENPRAAADAVLRLAAADAQGLGAMGLRGKEYVLQNHTYDVLAKRFLEAVSA